MGAGCVGKMLGCVPLTCHGQEIFDHGFRRRPELGSSMQLLEIALEHIELALDRRRALFFRKSLWDLLKQKPFWLDASVHGKGCGENRKANFQHQSIPELGSEPRHPLALTLLAIQIIQLFLY